MPARDIGQANIAIRADPSQYVQAMERAARETDKLERAQRKSRAEAREAERDWEAFRRTLLRFGAVAGTAVLAGLGAAVRVFADFEERMNTIRALTGASNVEVEGFGETIRSLARDTRFTAAEVGDAFANIVRATGDAELAIQTLPTVLDGAVASATGVAETTEILFGATNALGVSVENVASVMDVAVVAANSFNITQERLLRSLQVGGSAARSFGVDMQTAAAATGTFADAGASGIQAGERLNQAFAELIQPSTGFANALRTAGIALVDEQGNFRDTVDILDDLAAAGLQGARLYQLMGREAARAIDQLVQGRAKLREVRDGLYDVNNATRDIVEQVEQGFTPALRSAISSLADFAIEITQSTGIAGAATRGLETLGDLFDELSSRVDDLAKASEDSVQPYTEASRARVELLVQEREEADRLLEKYGQPLPPGGLFALIRGTPERLERLKEERRERQAIADLTEAQARRLFVGPLQEEQFFGPPVPAGLRQRGTPGTTTSAAQQQREDDAAERRVQALRREYEGFYNDLLLAGSGAEDLFRELGQAADREDFFRISNAFTQPLRRELESAQRLLDRQVQFGLDEAARGTRRRIAIIQETLNRGKDQIDQGVREILPSLDALTLTGPDAPDILGSPTLYNDAALRLDQLGTDLDDYETTARDVFRSVAEAADRHFESIVVNSESAGEAITKLGILLARDLLQQLSGTTGIISGIISLFGGLTGLAGAGGGSRVLPPDVEQGIRPITGATGIQFAAATPLRTPRFAASSATAGASINFNISAIDGPSVERVYTQMRSNVLTDINNAIKRREVNRSLPGGRAAL